jgi:tellurite resistance protein
MMIPVAACLVFNRLGIQMQITVKDASNYFRGLLLLIRKDRKVTQPEISMMKQIGKTLGFEKDFCDETIHEILDNKHIVDVPPKFSNNDLAIKFIKDGLVLASSDGEVHPQEVKWLESAAEKNGLDFSTFKLIPQTSENRKPFLVQFEVDELTIAWS